MGKTNRGARYVGVEISYIFGGKKKAVCLRMNCLSLWRLGERTSSRLVRFGMELEVNELKRVLQDASGPVKGH